jgi:hypothetical protein
MMEVEGDDKESGRRVESRKSRRRDDSPPKVEKGNSAEAKNADPTSKGEDAKKGKKGQDGKTEVSASVASVTVSTAPPASASTASYTGALLDDCGHPAMKRVKYSASEAADANPNDRLDGSNADSSKTKPATNSVTTAAGNKPETNSNKPDTVTVKPLIPPPPPPPPPEDGVNVNQPEHIDNDINHDTVLNTFLETCSHPSGLPTVRGIAYQIFKEQTAQFRKLASQSNHYLDTHSSKSKNLDSRSAALKQLCSRTHVVEEIKKWILEQNLGSVSYSRAVQKEVSGLIQKIGKPHEVLMHAGDVDLMIRRVECLGRASRQGRER